MTVFTSLRTTFPIFVASRAAWIGLPQAKETPTLARKFVVPLLKSWGADSETRDWGALVVSELATNACVHTNTRIIGVATARFRGTSYLAVIDDGPAPRKTPVMGAPAAPDAVSGRGLQLVSALSASCGNFRFGEGSLFWATHPLRGQRTPDTTPATPG